MGDPKYMGAKMFNLCQIGVNECLPHVPHNAIDAFNNMHPRYRVCVEWGIGGLKRNFARLIKPFDAMNPSIHIYLDLVPFNKLSS